MVRDKNSRLEIDAEKQQILDKVKKTGTLTKRDFERLGYIPKNVPLFEVLLPNRPKFERDFSKKRGKRTTFQGTCTIDTDSVAGGMGEYTFSIVDIGRKEEIAKSLIKSGYDLKKEIKYTINFEQ